MVFTLKKKANWGRYIAKQAVKNTQINVSSHVAVNRWNTISECSRKIHCSVPRGLTITFVNLFFRVNKDRKDCREARDHVATL